MKLAILINVKDRVSELAILLQSLRTSNYQEFDVYILHASQVDGRELFKLRKDQPWSQIYLMVGGGFDWCKKDSSFYEICSHERDTCLLL